MHAGTGVLAVVGSVCMTLALVLAWCLAGVRSSRFVKRCFPNPQYLLKAHLDFLMMTGLLFVFFLVFEHLRLTPPIGRRGGDERRLHGQPVGVPGTGAQARPSAEASDAVRRSDGAQFHRHHSRIWGRRVVRGARHRSHRALVRFRL